MTTTNENGQIAFDADDPVKNRAILNSRALLICILVLYISFVKFVGPKFMASRKPYSLKYVLLAYNFTMVIINALLVKKFATVFNGYSFYGLEYFWKYSCHPVDTNTNPVLIPIVNGMIDFYFSKLLDLFDTVFFVLRKKTSQLTFLHLFHHMSTLIAVWYNVHYVRDEICALLGALNCIVHVIMYSYYFLSALGPKVQKYLWWKKYLTQIQLIQFAIAMSVIIGLNINDCKISRQFNYIWTTLILINIGLFLNYYRETYVKKKE